MDANAIMTLLKVLNSNGGNNIDNIENIIALMNVMRNSDMGRNQHARRDIPVQDILYRMSHDKEN